MKYKTINGWTKQGMIDHIKANFKGKSMDKNENCLYRGPDGKKCAVGMFIPDDKYDTNMESRTYMFGDGIYEPFLKVFPHIQNYMPLDWQVMRSLQNRHDMSDPDTCLEAMISFIDAEVEDGN